LAPGIDVHDAADSSFNQDRTAADAFNEATGDRQAVAPVASSQEVQPDGFSLPADSVQRLRVGLIEWLRGVATFQEADAMVVLSNWLRQNIDVMQVNATLEELMQRDDGAKWAGCSVEDEPCNCPSGRIRYGHMDTRWLMMKGQKRIRCALSTFGGHDVAPGMLKQCKCLQLPSNTPGVNNLVEAASASDVSRALTTTLMLPRSNLSMPPRASWLPLEDVVPWLGGGATLLQLALLAKLFEWVENSRHSSKISAMIAKASAPALKPFGPCLERQNLDRCAGHGEYRCRAACHPHDFTPENLDLVDRNQLCANGRATELLWSCSGPSRVPNSDHPHAQAQTVLDAAKEDMCADERMAGQLEVYLDCEFVENYLRWTTPESEWLEEAYVTYVAGKKDSTYEWQAMNLVRSIDVFSSRPIVVVVFGKSFAPPLSWHKMPNVIVFKMKPHMPQVSFNFNKIRAMVSARILYGIQLDTDQIIAPGMDTLFPGTRREITANHPWPMMPVHWMSRDARPGEPYAVYAYQGWDGPKTMRWGHAHPTWSYWALPFLADLLHERFAAALSWGRPEIAVWDLPLAKEQGLLRVLKAGKTGTRTAPFAMFMQEDEDMLNVGLWRDKVEKQWCKYDLEFGLFKQASYMDPRLYYDPKWYPDGVPIIFISMHNTKRFEETDSLLTLLARCDRERSKVRCKHSGWAPPNVCKEFSLEDLRERRKMTTYGTKLCCCLWPRQEKPVYWAGRWFTDSMATPRKLPGGKAARTCILP